MADGTRWKATLVVEFYKEGSFYEAEDYLIERISPIKDILVWKSMPREPDPAEEQEWEERRKHRYQARERKRTGWLGALRSQLLGRA